MAFDLLTRQVNAIAHVVGHLGGQVTMAYSQLSLGQYASSVLGAHVMLGDALRLMAILEDTAYVEEMELPLFDKNKPDNSTSYMAMVSSFETLETEIFQIEAMITDMEAALAHLQEQIFILQGFAHQISQIQNATSQGDHGFQGTLDRLQETIFPSLFQLRDALESALDNYRAVLLQRERYLWYLNTVFKFILPRLQKKEKTATEEDKEDKPDPSSLDDVVEEVLEAQGAEVTSEDVEAIKEMARAAEEEVPGE